MFGFKSLKIEYDKKKVLGTGGFGTVYRGKYKNKVVAVKVSPIAGLQNRVAVSEVQVLLLCGKRPHENILKCYEVHNEVDKIIIALELCDANLDSWVNTKGKCILPGVIDKHDVCKQIVAGVEYLHGRNIVHRDLKPPNILLSVDNQTVTVKLADFGLCKIISEDKLNPTVSAISGTPGWMPPELLGALQPSSSGSIRPTLKTAPSMDIFSLGCMLHWVLSDGCHPFGQFFDQMANIMANNPVALNKSLHEASLLLEMISNKQEKRPLIGDVRRYFAKQTVYQNKINVFQTVSKPNLSPPCIIIVRVRTAADMEDGILKRRHFHIQYKNKTATTSKTILRKILSRLENVVVIELDGAGCTQFSRAMASSMESRELESLVAAEMKRYNNGRVLKLNVSAASSDNLTSDEAELLLNILINLDQPRLADMIKEMILSKSEGQLAIFWE